MAKAKAGMVFTGFPREAFSFLNGLKKDNSKSYFDEHRATYNEFVVEPSRAFVVALGEQLQVRVSPAIVAIPKGNGSLGRIHRDVRFSADKSPYNTHLQFRFWEGASKNAAPGFAVWLSPESVGLAAGIMAFDKPALERYRAAVVARKSGEALVAALAQAKKAKAKQGEPHYKRIPKGYDAEHPRAELLRYTGCGATLKLDTPKLVHNAKFATWCADRFIKLSPIHTWLRDHVFSG